MVIYQAKHFRTFGIFRRLKVGKIFLMHLSEDCNRLRIPETISQPFGSSRRFQAFVVDPSLQTLPLKKHFVTLKLSLPSVLPRARDVKNSFSRSGHMSTEHGTCRPRLDQVHNRTNSKVGEKLKREPAIMMDVKGPEIRTGYLHQEVDLKKDDLLDLIFSQGLLPRRNLAN